MSNLILNLGGDSDSSEEDEELPENPSMPNAADSMKAFEESFLDRFGATSAEFQESSQLVLVDCWNVNAWLTMVEEVERGRGGNTSAVEVYSQFLDQFPRAIKIWKALIGYYLQRNDDSNAESAFKNCLSKCRDVSLWESYVALVKNKTVDKISKHSEQYANAKKATEAAFERAVDNVGTMCESSGLWRKYVDFVKEWPDMSPMDAGIKMKMLRGVYQRILCLPVDDLDDFWKEYEVLETGAGEHLAAQLLPELRAKYQHAKVVNRDRKRLGAKIALDRIATPPTNSLLELQQLDMWNKLIKFEEENPGRLTPDLHLSNMRCLFERALCCFRHHAEVWLAYSRFEYAQPARGDSTAPGANDGIKIAKAVLQESIECNKYISVLRIALSEIDESCGDVTGARDALRAAFADIPSAFTFSVLQKHIRRLDGKISARKLFTETMSARLDGVLNFEVYLAHASLEAEINQDLPVAIKCMELARAVRPSLSCNVDYVRYLAALLRRLGDIGPIRWLFQNALGDDLCKMGSGDSNSVHGDRFVSDKKSRLALWEALLNVEVNMGLSTISRISELRKCVQEARAAAYPQGFTGVPLSPAVLSPDDFVFYEYPVEVFEKYTIPGVSLPLADAGVKNRCRGSALIDELIRRSDQDASDAGKKGKGRQALDISSALDVDSSILAGLPAFFKELLAKLPAFNGPTPDIEAFVDSLRRTVLPPRPADEPFNRRSTHQAEDQGSQHGSVRLKRGRRHDESAYEGGMDMIEDAEILGETDDVERGFQADEDASLALESRDDVFRRRQRQKLANE